MVSDYFVDDHPAVMRLIQMVVEEAGDRPLTVCGELAGRRGGLQALIEMGIRSVSVVPPLVPGVKEAVRAAHA